MPIKKLENLRKSWRHQDQNGQAEAKLNLKNYSTRYRAGLDNVINNINFIDDIANI